MKQFYLLCALLLTTSAYSMDETISIDSIVAYLNTAIENKETEKVAHWNNHLKLLINADWNLLNSNQKKQYQNFHSELLQKAHPLLCKRDKDLHMIKRLDRDVAEENAIAESLIEKLNQDKCDINWINVLGSNIETTSSPESLKQLRIKTLQVLLSLWSPCQN